jgi:hypothetical protein
MRLLVTAALCALSTQAMAQDGRQPPWPTGTDMNSVFEWQIANVEAVPADIVILTENAVVTLDRGSVTTVAGKKRAWFERNALNRRTAEEQGGRSGLIFWEADCAAGRSRILASTVYAGNNLTGRSTNFDEADGYTYDRPETAGAAMSAAICNGVFFFNHDG